MIRDLNGMKMKFHVTFYFQWHVRFTRVPFPDLAAKE